MKIPFNTRTVWSYIRLLWIVLIVTIVTVHPYTSFGATSAFKTLYTTEFLLDYDPDESAWVLDRFGDAPGNLELRFGNVASQSIKFDIVNNWFEFGSNVNLGQNELKNAALDNLPAPPVSPVSGQIYFNTTDQQTYIWDGIQWINLADSGHVQNTDTGTSANTFQLDMDNSGGDTFLQFAPASARYLKWDITGDRFVFNDDLRVEGNTGVVGEQFIAGNHSTASSDGVINLGRSGNNWQKIQFNSVTGLFETSSGLSVGGNMEIEGTSITLDSDNTGTAQNVSLIANQGTNNDGILRYNALLKRWEISNDGAAYVAVAGPGPQGATGAQGPTGPQGATGAQGPQGSAGSDGYTTLFSQTAATTEQCANGGYVFKSGLDTNRNSVLDSGEVATSAVICNGGGSGGGGDDEEEENILAGTCVVTRTASYSGSAQYSVALSGMASYTDNNLQVTLANGIHVSSINNSNGGSSSWVNPTYLISILGSSQSFMFYLNYHGTPPAGQTPYVTSAKITKFGDVLHCSVVNS